MGESAHPVRFDTGRPIWREVEAAVRLPIHLAAGTITAMIRLLDRYLIGDLLRVIGLTTAVLVTVIAFGATIKPLASGLLAPGDILQYVLLAIVPMLQFAIPFAAGFGATIVLQRMTAENEVLAVSAGGVSYPRFLRPVVGLGIVLSLVLLVLVQVVIPRFWVMMQETVAEDATRLFVASLERGEAFRIGDLQIYADAYRIESNPAETGADVRISLSKLAAIEEDESGRLAQSMTARIALVDFYRVGDQSFMKLIGADVSRFDRESGVLGSSPRAETSAIPIPNTFRESPKFMSLWALLELRTEPERFYKVGEARANLAAALSWQAMWQELNRRLEETGQLVLTRDDTSYVVHAAGISRGRLIAPAGESVRIEETRSSGRSRTLRAASAVIEVNDQGALQERISFRLALRNLEIDDAGSDPPYQREQIDITGLDVTDLEGTDRYESLPPHQLLDLAALLRSGSGDVERTAARLEHQLESLAHEIYARISQRTALAVTGLLLLMLGSVLAMTLRNSLPLVIYLWAFLPSIADILLISGGEQMIRDGSLWGGTIVLWSGNGVMTLLVVLTYFRLARN